MIHLSGLRSARVRAPTVSGTAWEGQPRLADPESVLIRLMKYQRNPQE